jgi:prevent-host-death family protein
MASVGAFQAKTHLSGLLKRVKRGERITITTHGIPTAILIPVEEPHARPAHAAIVDGMRKLRMRVKSIRRGNVNVRELVEEGRRF